MKIQKASILFLLLPVYLLLNGCKENTIPVKIDRFEQALFETKENAPALHFKNLANRYPTFFHSFAVDMLNISEEEDISNFSVSLNEFINYPTIRQLKREVDSVYPDLSVIEAQLGKAMYQYHSFFPNYKIPRFISFVSEFGFANVTYDSIIGIGLDMYLGSHYPLYRALEFPDFMVAKLSSEYIVPNTIRAMAIGKYENQLKDKRFIAMMLFEGKVKYFLKKLLPEVEDSIIFGYSPVQLKWCEDNQQMIWAHFIENKLLYSNNAGEYMRYFNDGPFTIATGVPQESAPSIGVFAGYKIIEKYMQENKNISLQDLMENSNWDQILQKSAYRP